MSDDTDLNAVAMRVRLAVIAGPTLVWIAEDEIHDVVSVVLLDNLHCRDASIFGKLDANTVILKAPVIGSSKATTLLTRVSKLNDRVIVPDLLSMVTVEP